MSYDHAHSGPNYALHSNPSLLAYLGEGRSKMLQEFSTLTQKYGAQAGACDTAFKATCPWDNAGITSIVMKLMVSIKCEDSVL